MGMIARILLPTAVFLSLSSNAIAQALTQAPITPFSFNTEVMLADRSVIRISLHANFTGSTPLHVEPRARNSVFTFLNNRQVTLHELKHNSVHMQELLAHVKANLGAKDVYPLGYTVQSLPDEAFELRARTVSAVLASGEGVDMTFSSRASGDRANATTMAAAYDLLSTQSLNDLKYLQHRLAQKCQDAGANHDCRVISLKITSRASE